MLLEPLGNFVERWRNRHVGEPTGDRGGLGTRGDLLNLLPPETVGAFRRDIDGTWNAVDSEDYGAIPSRFGIRRLP
jgi:hypothetical protein